MAATPSIVVKKSTAYKGGTRVWSNRYHFSGGTPANSTAWTTFSDNVVNAEKLALTAQTTIVETIGYAAGSDVPVFTKTYTTVGSISATGVTTQHLDVAALARWATNTRTSKNHPIYLFSYWHNVISNNASTPELLQTAQKTAFTTYANAWTTGFSDGTNTYYRAGPNGATGSAPVVEANTVTHQFPR